ncbi:glutathione S-transferase U20 [Selaginella moellendorffii]|nr:glutathione S-transferase U20 [Selaginella moellendorffii]|eukprot:XP_002980955.2 glutathione S-transferase U20 [Selaginella moellendorffii]
MGEEGLKLLTFWSSPFACRVRLALDLKGLHYDLQEEDLFNAKSALLLESNPVHKKIPVLIHNGKAICESMNIVEYVDEVWPDRGTGFLLPRDDAFARATARFWADFVDKKFLSLTAASFKAAISSGEEKERANDEMIQDMVALERFLESQGGVFFSGSNTSMGFVDIAASFLPWWLPTYTEIGRLRVPGPDTCPLLHRWIAAVKDSPEAKAAFPDQQELLDFTKVRFEEVKKRFAQ